VIGAEPGVLLLDDRRVFVAANEPAASLLGITTDALIGRRADEFMPLVAKSLYPLAWQGFLLRRVASGEYAAQRADGSLSHLAYVGFAHRPIRGLHFFVLEPLPGRIDEPALIPRMQKDHIQVGADLPDDLRARLVAEADRQEWRLPVGKGAQNCVLAALFDQPQGALDALARIRTLESVEASVATAAGSTPDVSLTVLAGRVPYASIGEAVESIRIRGGRIMTSLDERYVRRMPPAGTPPAPTE
jgi:hypothetical protein